MISVYTVRFVADMMRNEPKNIGVILVDLENPEDFASKFLGRSQETGKFRRTHQVSAAIYKRWVEYFEEKVQSGQISDIHRMQTKRPSQFFLRLNHENFSGQTARQLVDDAYNELVKVTAPAIETLKDKTETVIELSGVNMSADFDVEIDLGSGSIDFAFDFSTETRRGLAVAEVVSFGSRSNPELKRIANDFAFRASTLLSKGIAVETVAFLDITELEQSQTNRNIERLLRPIETFGTILDVSESELAARSLAEIVGY